MRNSDYILIADIVISSTSLITVVVLGVISYNYRKHRHLFISLAAYILLSAATRICEIIHTYKVSHTCMLVILTTYATVSIYMHLLTFYVLYHIKNITVLPITSHDNVSSLQAGDMDNSKSELNKVLDSGSWVVGMVSVHSPNTLQYLGVSSECATFGYTIDLIEHKSLIDLIHQEDIHMFQDLLSNSTSFSCSYRFKHASGAYVRVESTCKQVYLDQVNTLVVVTRDVARRQSVFDREMLIREENIRVEVNMTHALNIAHDLRTPLAVFDLCLKNIEKSTSHLEENAFSDCEYAVKYMRFIVDRSVDSCRVLQGEKPNPVYENIDICALVQDCATMISTYPKSVPLHVNMEKVGEMHHWVCDRLWLWAIVVNFLINACDNTMSGYIELRVTITNGNLHFEIIDTGVGINDIDKCNIFCPFVKLNNQLRPAHGVGIGLFSNAWKIRRLGGSYGVKDNAGGGTVFSFTLPPSKDAIFTRTTLTKWSNPERFSRSATDALEEIPKIRDSLRSLSFDASRDTDDFVVEPKKPSILVVDDTLIFRKVLVRQLKCIQKMDVDVASDGDDALEMLKMNNYDIAFIDRSMPRMNGDICIKEYKKWHADTCEGAKRSVLVLMSADAIMNSEAFCADETIAKPLNFMHVAHMITKSME